MFSDKFEDFELKVGYYVYWKSEERGDVISIITEVGNGMIVTKDIYGDQRGYIEHHRLDTIWCAYKISVSKTKEELLRIAVSELL